MPHASLQIWTHTRPDFATGLSWAALWITLALAAEWRAPGLFLHLLPDVVLDFADRVRRGRGPARALTLTWALAAAVGASALLAAGTPLGQNLLSAALAPAIAEEFFFRGALLQALARRMAPAPAILVSSLCFALLHPPGPPMLLAGAFGVGLATLVWRTGRLALAVGIHFTFNAALLLWIAAAPVGAV